MAWKPITPDRDRVQYHVDLDPDYEWLPHELLDDVPKKSIGQQVLDAIEMSERLAESKLRMLDLPDAGDVDPDDADPGVDEWSDPEDYRRAAMDLNEKADKIKRSRKKEKAASDEPAAVSKSNSVVSSDFPPSE